MPDEKFSDVLVSADGGDTWRRHAEVPGTPTAAIKLIREQYPDLAANEDTLYFATSALNARKFEKQMVATWALVDVDLAALAPGAPGNS